MIPVNPAFGLGCHNGVCRLIGHSCLLPYGRVHLTWDRVHGAYRFQRAVMIWPFQMLLRWPRKSLLYLLGSVLLYRIPDDRKSSLFLCSYR